jgi:hypothetical protein
VLVNETQIPERSIGAGENLRDIHSPSISFPRC